MALPLPCTPSPCGANAICTERNGAGACSCLPDHIGNPYEGCRPECVINSDCAPNRACIRSKCQDPCPGTCGQNAQCQVINHLPSCTCIVGFTGDPFRYCNRVPDKSTSTQDNCELAYGVKANLFTFFFTFITVIEADQIDPCHPSPCGPNSICRENNGQAVCSCLPTYIGSPPSCRPECVVSSECPTNRACVNQKCVDPCPAPCGNNANCKVINHSPICTCRQGFTGDAFSSCFPTPRKDYRDLNNFGWLNAS